MRRSREWRPPPWGKPVGAGDEACDDEGHEHMTPTRTVDATAERVPRRLKAGESEHRSSRRS
ncbi:hypothetical protein ACIP4X_18740 [Streptomyces sp. NPDC088817]|uniref:hypothetical protein n=1 Tax=unclassified Streptomyces TaxID=2593676 RepID=UPI0036EC2F05